MKEYLIELNILLVNKAVFKIFIIPNTRKPKLIQMMIHLALEKLYYKYAQYSDNY